MDAIIWFLQGIWSGIAGPVHVLLNLGTYMDFSDPENILRVVYYGASVQLFFLFFNTFVTVFVIGIFYRRFLWGVVVGLEGFANVVGRIAAWAGLLMVLQQVMVIFLQSIFRAADISFGPFGVDVTYTVGWWSDSLKLYNAIIVCMCCAWTFVQGGHVRVDLVYARLSHRGKRLIDMAGCLFFMMPMAVLTWLYAWFFMWRHLITPKPSASDTLEGLLNKSRALRWNVETIGFSPNGFNAYFLFKILLVSFAGLVFLHAIAFFYRSWLEYTEGEASAGKHLDRDVIGSEAAARAAEIH
jgi:TRAP-type mannitol/chloroaromatic compound transport system permease small subunit